MWRLALVALMSLFLAFCGVRMVATAQDDGPPPPIIVNLNEGIGVAGGQEAVGAATTEVTEPIRVSDPTGALPGATVVPTEGIGVSDAVTVLASPIATLTEGISLADATTIQLSPPPGPAADHLFFSINPVASVTSGTVFNVQVQARDSGSGNAVDAGFSGNITLSAATVGGSNFTTGNVVAAVNGVASFNVFLNNAANAYQITASTPGLTSGLSSAFNVTADHLTITTVIANMQAGTPFSVSVEARDGNNAVAENFSGTVNLNAAAAGGSNFNGGTQSATAVAGSVSFTNLALNNTANNYQLTASTAGLTGALSNAFNVTATHLAVNAVPNVRAGDAFNATVEARDADNAVAENFTGNVGLNAAAAGGSNFNGGTATVAAVAGSASFVGLVLNNAADGYVVTASSAGLTNGLSNTFNVTARALVITTVIANHQAGTPFSVSVEARDGNNAVAENFISSVSLNAAAVGGANFNGGTRNATAVAGSVSFTNLVLNNAADNYQLTASSAGPINGLSSAFNVTATHLAVVALANVRAGDAFNAAVEARDANNAVAENFVGNVALNAAATGGSNFVGGTASVAAAAGTASFVGVVLNNAADGYVVTASSAGLTSGISNVFNVIARQLVIATVVANHQAGTPFALSVEARDANNAVAENFTGQVSLNAAAIGGSNFNGGTRTASAVAGALTFTGLTLNDAADNYQLTASSAGPINGLSNAFNVTATHLAVLTVPNVRAGDPFTVVVQARDANNALAENFTGNVSLNAGATGGSAFVGGTPNVVAIAGSATFVGLVLNNAADGYVITASSAGLTSGISNAFNVTARQLTIATVVANMQAGTPFSVAVEARDANNAVAENFTGQVRLNAAAPVGGSNFDGGEPTATAVAGSVSFTNLTLSTAASGYTISAASAGLLNGVSNAFNVTPASMISINDVSVTEGDGGATSATFTVSLSVPSTRTVTVNFATAGVTATSGIDFVSTTGPLTFAPGVTTRTVTVTVNGDLLNEPDEIFSVDLTGASGGSISDSQGVGTILNDDPLPVISVGDVSVVEGTPVRRTAVLEVRLSAPSGQTVVVNFATADGTAVDGVGELLPDYVATAGTIEFVPGETLQTINVSLENDTRSEPDEVFFFDLSEPTNATVGTSRATVTIFDDDSPANQLADLRELVRALDLKGGRETSLLAKLRLECGSLNAFANEVLAQTDKAIMPAQASALLDAVDRLLADLLCAPRAGSG